LVFSVSETKLKKMKEWGKRKARNFFFFAFSLLFFEGLSAASSLSLSLSVSLSLSLSLCLRLPPHLLLLLLFRKALSRARHPQRQIKTPSRIPGREQFPSLARAGKKDLELFLAKPARLFLPLERAKKRGNADDREEGG
jgi:hypothetical protein